MNTNVWIFLLVLLLAPNCIHGRTDQTMVAKATGEDVVNVVVARLSDIFGVDFGFMKRLAYVQSKYGIQADFPGGIWQLAEPLYKTTTDGSVASLRKYKTDIQTRYGINWDETKWSDLSKPLYSGIAMRLFIASKLGGGGIPNVLADQAEFWKDNFNSADTIDKFTETIKEVESRAKPCTAKMDLVVLLDGSGSVNSLDFTRMLDFTGKLFTSFSLDNVRMGLIVFSSTVKVEIELENDLKTLKAIQQRVLQVKQPGEMTNTNLGIQEAINMFKRAQVREGIPKILAIITDGESQGGVGKIHEAKAEGIDSFAIGVGNYKQIELEEIASKDTTRVFTLDKFNELATIFNKLSSATCQVPQTAQTDKNINDSIDKGGERKYKIKVPAEGITIELSLEKGSVLGYWAYGSTTTNPNSALNDGELKIQGDGRTVIPSASNADTPEGKMVYVSVSGTRNENKYIMLYVKGNSTGQPSKIAIPKIYFESYDLLALYSEL